jgi:ABC-type sugar transport system substrate-binding protein
VKRFWTACAFVSLFVWSAAAAQMNGVIADSKCQHTDASAKSIQCTEHCIQSGASAVFIDTADNKVYKISNPEKAKGHYGHKVVVNGQVNGDTVSIQSIKNAA